jgi:integrase
MYRLDDEHGYELPENNEPKLLEECARSITRGLYVVITLALCTGMRSGEIKHLRWNQVFLDGEAYLIVGVSKTRAGRQRRIPLNADAVAALSEWAGQFPDRSPGHYISPSEKYSKEPEGRLAAVYGHDPTRPMGSRRVAWKAACRRAGIQMRFHDLRHTAVSRMLRAGTPLTTVAQIVGWSPSTMYIMAKRYAHILQPEMRKAVAVLRPRVQKHVRAVDDNAPKRQAFPGRMRSRYCRQELYTKVWEVPMQILAKEYGVSAVARAKTCRALDIPVPGRGYWAKKDR